jgi:hypothetical protein
MSQIEEQQKAYLPRKLVQAPAEARDDRSMFSLLRKVLEIAEACIVFRLVHDTSEGDLTKGSTLVLIETIFDLSGYKSSERKSYNTKGLRRWH